MFGRDFDDSETHNPMKPPVQYHDIPYDERWKVREEYTKLQAGKCFYCGHSLFRFPPTEITDRYIDWTLFPSGKRFLDAPIQLQHDHNTGWTQGVVHAYCNAVMWQYEGR
jgi:hypothetical protein